MTLRWLPAWSTGEKIRLKSKWSLLTFFKINQHVYVKESKDTSFPLFIHTHKLELCTRRTHVETKCELVSQSAKVYKSFWYNNVKQTPLTHMTHIMYVMLHNPSNLLSSQLPPKWYVPTRPQPTPTSKSKHTYWRLNGGCLGPGLKKIGWFFSPKRMGPDLWILHGLKMMPKWWWLQPHHLRRSFWGAKESQIFFLEISRSNHTKVLGISGWRGFPLQRRYTPEN